MLRFVLPSLLLVLVDCAPLAAQRYTAAESDLALVSVNALVGGASAGLVALIRGGDVTDAVVAGALGGGVSFLGKRIVAADFDGAGLVGRQVSAIGHGIVVDAGRGEPLLSEIWLTLGPAQVRVPSPRRAGARGWDARIDVASSAAIVYAASQSELDFDWSSSLGAGSPVFRAPRHRIHVEGERLLGVAPLRLVLLSGDASDQVLVHEVVHVIQQDFIAMAWSYPLEEALASLAGLDERWLERFPLGATFPLLGEAIHQTTGAQIFVLDWMETEAYSLSRTLRPRQFRPELIP